MKSDVEIDDLINKENIKIIILQVVN